MIEPAKIKGHHILAWRKLKQLLFKQANYICGQCGKSHSDLIVHHKDGCGLNNTLDNLQVLCVNCHRKTERPHLTQVEFANTGRRGRKRRGYKDYVRAEYNKTHPRA